MLADSKIDVFFVSMQIVEACMERYSTEPKEDARLLKQTKGIPPRKRMAIMARLGEKVCPHGAASWVTLNAGVESAGLSYNYLCLCSTPSFVSADSAGDGTAGRECFKT